MTEEIDVQRLRDDFLEFLAELMEQFEELQSLLLTDNLEIADRLLNTAQRCSSGILLFISVFESLIRSERIEGLQELGFSWSKIARMIGISRITLYRRRLALGIGNEVEFNQLEDHEVDELVASIIQLSPNSGEVMVRGALRARGVKIQRWRIRESLMRVDPVRRRRRQRLRIERRVYRVPGPNSLWHLDGHHKLVRWRIVIHGAIDGYSRCITYLKCATNNEAATVLTFFQYAVQRFSVPIRIRCDHGTENIHVARWMLDRYGTASNPVLTGLSVHNQRIERLWRDVGDAFVRYYKSLFYFMEENHILDPLNEIHLYALHYIYLPRISRSIEEFTLAWNNHPVRTENCRSPIQIWVDGFYQHASSCQRAVQTALNQNDIDFEQYGIDDDGPLPELQTNNHMWPFHARQYN
ncbi:uncharacterized protein LOC110247927 [Paramuricea clavata]|uniref:Uncharacterized protein LOC110247927 n=1 Tax=Paramuricea clavata TaxID=317549 RepID=A0A7D9E454_PARCT|nr:uncharacterized protein LOC110247927 [Paramuricea clavata]